ncbi:MAG: LCP family protein [Porcipelethomonas sp.]
MKKGKKKSKNKSAVRSRNASSSNVKSSKNKGSSRKGRNSKKGVRTTLKDKLIIAASIIAGLAIVIVMVLNIPIIEVEKTKNGQIYTEHVSILNWLKDKQPLIDKEGVLSADENSYELTSGADEIDDKREFTNGQIIEGQFSVLCLGFDEDRSNTDVIMVFQFDINNDKINVLQIPRDCYVPDYTYSETCKINSVYGFGDENLTNIQRIVDAVRDNFGIPIDRYITTGCDDIVDMVDLIGGIPINLPEQVIYSYDKVLYPGEQVLNGEQAELFVRARKGYYEGDIGRVKAQRIFLAACMEKALNMGTIEVTKFLTEVYNKGYIATDMSLRELSILSDFGSNIDLDDVTVNMVPGEAVDDYNGYSVYSIHKNATVDMLNKYFRPYQTDLTYDSLPIVEIVESDYYSTDIYDQNQDTLQEISDGATPGESKKPTESQTASRSYEDEDFYEDNYYEDDDFYGY